MSYWSKQVSLRSMSECQRKKVTQIGVFAYLAVPKLLSAMFERAYALPESEVSCFTKTKLLNQANTFLNKLSSFGSLPTIVRK